MDRFGAPRWHPLWEGNPRIARPGEAVDAQELIDGSGARSYIAEQTAERWTWRANPREPGELYLNAAEQAFASQHRPVVIIEPHLKARASPNKRWPYWGEFARLAHAAGIALYQMGPLNTRPLQYVSMILTPDPRRAAAVLGRAKAYVGPDGFLHHAAAALSVPAVVIRGGFIHADVTGYPSQRNLFTGTGLGCGMRVKCKCCEAAMAAILPEMVMDELRAIL